MDTKFQISEFETVDESAEVFTPEAQGVKVDSGNASRPKLGSQNQTSPDLHLPSVCQTNTAEATSPRVRPGSDPTELEPGPSGDAGGFRVRSKSAPPVMWAAMRYGRELRRMSDDFNMMTFQGLPRPKSASQANEVKKADGWTDYIRGMFGASWRKENLDKNKKF